jgi:hypothetical protein
LLPSTALSNAVFISDSEGSPPQPDRPIEIRHAPTIRPIFLQESVFVMWLSSLELDKVEAIIKPPSSIAEAARINYDIVHREYSLP